MSEESDQLVEGDELLPEAGVDGQTADITDLSDDAESPEDNPPEEEFEEVERDGKKYSVPKALKPELMMHADYTRKTQEVAETRKQLEAREAEIIKQAERGGEISKERVKLETLNERLAQYDAVKWDELEQFDQANGTSHAQRVLREQIQLRAERDRLGGELFQKEQSHLQDVQRARAKQLEEGNRVLASKIPNWSPEVAGKISAFVQSAYGLSPEEVGQVTDPRWVMVAHDAMKQAEAAKKTQAVQRHAKSQEIQPAATPQGRAPAAKDPDRMTNAEWNAWQDRLEAQKRKARG